MEAVGSPLVAWSDSGDGAISAATPVGYKGGSNCKMVNSNMFFLTDGIVGTNAWQLVEHEFTTSSLPNATWYVRLRLWSAAGTVWFDNVCLHEAE